MKSLPGVDAGFLYMETPTVHMHTLKLMVFDFSKITHGFSYDAFRAEMTRRIDQLPPFRRRLIEIPFGLGHPVWIEDPEFDLERHLELRHAPTPGSHADLCRVVSEIAGAPLERSRPLWQLTLVDGLAGGRVAFVGKIHHSVADGGAALELLLRAMRPPAAAGSEPAWAPEPLPTRAQLLRRALRDGLAHLLRLPALLLRTLRGLFGLLDHLRRVAVRAPRPFHVPRLPFNAALTARRSFAVASLELGDLKRVAKRHGVTVNTVVLALCSGALRRYLALHGSIPERPLLVSVPTSTDAGASGRFSGNRVSTLIASLCSDVEDPLERLRAISAIVDEAKARYRLLGADLMERWIDFTPPRPHSALMRWWSRTRMADRFPPPFNMVISNVIGPRELQSVGRAVLAEIYSVGPILDGMGLNITTWSYAGTLSFAALGCPDHGVDLSQLLAQLPAALEELDAAGQRAESGEPESEKQARARMGVGVGNAGSVS